MLNTPELKRRRNRVLGAIDKLSVVDALAVMGEAIRELAMQESVGQSAAANDAEPSSADLILGGEFSRFKIDHDPEVRDFIYGLRGMRSVPQIAALAKEKFGDRAPSKMALYRYFNSLKYRRGTREQQHD
ncbi:hypothetical protein HOP52_16170 [Halomonas campisalis]|uniref:Uncharacterized protein n=1 Tax=Billgrantia campisalis TaxID=74661 RepID=A0ABS9PDU8_9GAMM|nr:hypothetical protein [Halomonas campisalis]MCG6659295.1 hypothetical protein [Halomonas campisalis]MDR5864294.1 hypothetical protein [Halomonas campisalis]